MWMIIKAFKHLKIILIHKYYFIKYCFLCGLYLQGIFHNMSKFSPTKFCESVKYFTGKNNLIGTCKADKGITYVKIPFKYMLETFCDWLSDAIVYRHQKDLNVDDEIKWWNEKRKNITMHKSSINLMDYFMIVLFQDENFLKNHDLIKYIKIRYENDTLDKVDWDNFIQIF